MNQNSAQKSNRRVSVQKVYDGESPIKVRNISDEVADPFEVANEVEEIDHEIYYSKQVKDHDELPKDQEHFEGFLSQGELIDLETFDENDVKHLRICPKYFIEGRK